MTSPAPTPARAPRPRVGSPIIFRPTKDAPERVVKPCSWKHREYWLSGYIVASCKKCCDSLEYLNPDEASALAADLTQGA